MLALAFLQAQWRWFCLGGLIIVGGSCIRQSGELAACRASLAEKPKFEQSQAQAVKLTQGARAEIHFKPKPCPPAAVDGAGKCPPCECPDVFALAIATQGADAQQSQSQTAQVQPAATAKAHSLGLEVFGGVSFEANRPPMETADGYAGLGVIKDERLRIGVGYSQKKLWNAEIGWQVLHWDSSK